ncbi:hypothetical protein ILYODFUR_032516 [Ilyodon furcidens]|uniref:Uncharacterized protein n=1 Tax=Ilyodon furcidens TaxID=33524 RepID=A0ABV0ST67_9TELE
MNPPWGPAPTTGPRVSCRQSSTQRSASAAKSAGTTQTLAGAPSLQAATVHPDIPKSLNHLPRPCSGTPMAPHPSPPSPNHYSSQTTHKAREDVEANPNPAHTQQNTWGASVSHKPP